MVALRLRARTAGLLDAGAESNLADELGSRKIDPYQAAGVLLERITREGEERGDQGR